MAENNKTKEQLKEITDKLEQGIQEVFESEKYKEYLNTMSKFYNYSFNNTMLIAMQKPDATLIAGYNAWKDKFDRHVLKGEKGIRIIAPAPIRRKEEVEKIDPDTQEPVIDALGKPVMEVIETTTRAFKVIPVFDVSQTDGKPLPELTVEELNGDVKDFDLFMEALTQTAPVPIGYEDIPDETKGYYHLEDKRIAIQDNMSQIQTVKTAIHEISHATLHDVDLNLPEDKIPQEQKKDRKTKEVEAESIAYTVCQHYGIDTSDYSFGYVAGWSSGKELSELRSSLETIRSTAATLINTIDAKVAELQQMKGQEIEESKEQQEELQPVEETVLADAVVPEVQKPLSQEEQLLTGKEDSFGIYQLKSGDELHYHRFEGLERLQKHGLSVEKDNYELIYTAPLKEGQTLDDIFEQFNMFRPEDFKGHSLSVSDIVMLHKDGVNTAQYVDSFGFASIPDFLEQKAVIDQPLEQQETQAAYEFSDRYLMIHECDEGYDYTFYDKNYKEMDGGVYDDPNVALEQAVHIILTDDPFPDMERTVVNYEALEEKVDAANAIVPQQTLTFYVAECSEFTSLGEYHDNLTLDEAIAAFEAIPPERMHGVKGLGFKLHTDGQEEYMDSEFDILTGKTIDVDTINHIVEFRDNPLVQQAVKEVIERFPDAEVWDRETKAQETAQPEIDFDSACEAFAVELDQFSKDYDLYSYNDNVENQEENINSITELLREGETEPFKQWLQEIVDDGEPKEDAQKAAELLSRMDDLMERRERNPLTKVEELEESNYDQIDGVLNNLQPKAEEKREKMSIMEKLQANKEKTAKQNQPEKVTKEVEKKKEISMD